MQVTKSASENMCVLDKGILPIQVISIEAAKTHEAEFIDIWKNEDDRYIFCCYSINYDWKKYILYTYHSLEIILKKLYLRHLIL